MKKYPGNCPSAKSILLIALFVFLAACQNTEENYDVIVIGAGLMGSSTAWHLASSGQKVLLLEKQAPEYTQGSSLGEARIARSLGGEGDVWSYMHNRSVDEIEQLISFLNTHEPGHSMSDIYTTSPVNYVRHSSHAQRIENIQHNQVDRYEYARTALEANELFNLKLSADTIMWREYKDHSGTINPKTLIAYLHKAIKLLDGSVHYNTQVSELARNGNSYNFLVTNSESGVSRQLNSNKLVSAAGPYTGRLLENIAPYFNHIISPRRVFLAFFALDSQFYNSLSEADKLRFSDLYPAINSTVPTPQASFFTMLEGQSPQGSPIIKIGGHNQRSDIKDLDSVWQVELAEHEIQWARESTLRHLSLLDLGIGEDHLILARGYSCVYSLTETEIPYVTQIPNDQGEPDQNMVVVAGLSGVGAKGAMTYGLIAADLILGDEESDPMYQKAKAAFGYDRLLADLASNSLN